MADRPADHRGLGALRGGVFRHDHEAQDQPHLRRELVLPAYIVTVAMLHTVNNISLPDFAVLAASYSVYAGVQSTR
jgi:hypothetical protein